MAITVEGRVYRATYDNAWLADISEAFTSVSVSMDTEREYTWEMNATMTWEGWQRLRPYYDWLAPELIVTYPDGTVRRGQLGLYLVLDSPETHQETSATVSLVAEDPLWLLDRGGFPAKYSVPANMRKTRAVREIIDGAVLTDAESGKQRYAIAQSDHIFRKPFEWPRSVSRLDACNEILEGCAHYPLWTSKRGIITTKRMGESRLANRHPVRVYSTHVPERFTLDRRDRPLGELASEVVGVVQTTPKAQDLTNEILIVSDSARGSRIEVLGRITHPNNPRSVLYNRGPHGRRKVRRIHNQVLEEDATAREVADALVDELSTRNVTIRLEVLPDPEPEFARETIGLAIWNAHGDRIALGQYAVHRVSYGFTPATATMTIDCGRVDDARDYLGGL